jgi:hypothetical protein
LVVSELDSRTSGVDAGTNRSVHFLFSDQPDYLVGAVLLTNDIMPSLTREIR